MIFPNMKESGLYGRSLFAYLQKEKSGQDPCTDLAAFWPLPASCPLVVYQKFLTKRRLNGRKKVILFLWYDVSMDPICKRRLRNA